MKEKVNELFAMPIGLQPVIKIDGEQYYGSEDLNRKLLVALMRSPITRMHVVLFKKLVDDKLIIPCFAERSMIKFLRRKITGRPSDPSQPEWKSRVLGFYSSSIKKIVIIIDNNLNLIGYSHNEQIAKLVAHEVIHMIFGRNKSISYKIYKEDLNKFYGKVFQREFSLEGKYDEVVSTIVKNMVKYEMANNISLSRIKNDLVKLKKFTTKKDDFDRILNLHILAIRTYLTVTQTFWNNYLNFRDVLKPIYDTYKDYGDQGNHRLVQELVFPSEVIAILTEMGVVSSKLKLSLKVLTA